MYPILLQLGPIPIHTYGAMIALGFLICVKVVKWLGKRSQLDVEVVLDYTFWALILGFLGSRILYIITRWDSFSSDPISMFKIWEGGLVFLGGPIAVVPFTYFFVKKHRMPFWKLVDVAMPGLTIAHVFGRLGCVAAGCCYGRPTGGDWGFRFNSELVDVSLRGVPLHPVQLYESSALLVLFFGLLVVFSKKRFDGQVFLTYFMAYPIIRSVVEIYRGDLIRGFVIDGILSTSQFLSLIIFVIATAGLAMRLRYVEREKKLGKPA
jgi:phosphatidylglycerol:prolipoprotein diacylglycerol transferase